MTVPPIGANPEGLATIWISAAPNWEACIVSLIVDLEDHTVMPYRVAQGSGSIIAACSGPALTYLARSFPRFVSIDQDACL